MNLNKKVIEGAVLTGMLAILTTVTATTTHTIPGTEETENVTTDISFVMTEYHGTAGVISAVAEQTSDALQTVTVSTEQNEVELVAVAEEETPTTDSVESVEGAVDEATTTETTLSEEEQAWQNKLMPVVEESLNVRAAADENAEVVGKLYAGSAADIVEVGDTWTHITSGSVDGYVKNEYCVFGSEAYAYAQANCSTVATTLTGGLRFRTEPSEDASVISSLEEGTVLTVDTGIDAGTDWVAVSYGGTTGYVAAAYVTTSLDVNTGVTIAEEQAAAAAAAAEEQVSGSSTTTVQKASVAASADDVTLLGALIQCEAGYESYEGQLAVGAVVMNRLRSGAYGSSIYSVIYASGQFSPAGSGQVASVIASGVSASCLQAAQEAINGTDNVGGATCFRNVSSGHAGIVIGNHVFW